MSLKDTARFVRVNGDIYRRAPIFEQEMKTVSYVSDEEARQYFASIGADLRKLDLMRNEEDDQPAPAVEVKPKRGRKSADTPTIVVGDSVSEIEALLKGDDE